MKTRTFVYLILMLALIATLFSVACRAREEIPAPGVTQPKPPPPAGRQPTPAGTRLPGGTGQNDLVPSGASVTTMGNPGQVRVVTSARNTGTGTISSSFTIRWYPHERSDVVGCSWDVEAREVNGRDAEVSCTTYTYAERGEMHWRVVVDADNDVRETNENNNERTGTVTIAVGGQPPPSGQAPPAPTNCTGRVATGDAVTISWQFSGNTDGFRIYQGTTSSQRTVGADDRTNTIMGLRSGVPYHFDVRAFNAAGESRADACSADVTPR